MTFWSYGFYRGKMRPFEWVLIQYDWYPDKKGNFGYRDVHRGRRPREHERRDLGDTSTSQEMAKITSNHRKERGTDRVSLTAAERTRTYDSLVLGSPASKIVRS